MHTETSCPHKLECLSACLEIFHSSDVHTDSILNTKQKRHSPVGHKVVAKHWSNEVCVVVWLFQISVEWPLTKLHAHIKGDN